MVFDFSCYLLRLVRFVPQTSMVFIPPWVGDVGLRLPYCSSPVLPKKDSHIYAWWLARVREEPTSLQISISTAFVYRRYDCPDFDCGLDLLLKTRKNSAGGPGMSQTGQVACPSIPFYSPVNYKSGILINDGCTKTKK